jgi:hypothetical protein
MALVIDICSRKTTGETAQQLRRILTYHDKKAEKHDRSDLAAEPEHFTVGNEDDGQVLEDGVDRNAQELETIFRGARI